MQEFQILFNNSPWFILICLLVGAAYAALLYYKNFKKKNWEKKISILLSVLRFFVVSLLCFLLIGPYIKQIKNNIEKPMVVFAIDNSESVKAVEDSSELAALKNSISEMGATIADRGYTVDFRSFVGEGKNSFDTLNFDYQSSDLNGMLLEIASDYEGTNLSTVVLVSDGIYNQGMSPTYSPYRFAVSTIGLGDTIPKQDININNLYYNKIAYQGNKFPLMVELENTGFSNETVELSLNQAGKRLATKSVKLAGNRGITSVEFVVDANNAGMQHYVLEATPKVGEFTNQNNTAHAYIEVIDGKEQILLVSNSPHPDIKAIRSSVESNKNYELSTIILSMDEQEKVNELLKEKYDLVIFHQLPGKGRNGAVLQPYLEASDSRFFIVGNQTDLNALNEINSVVGITNITSNVDEVSPVYNVGFSGFQTSTNQQETINRYIPITVPFANTATKNGAQVILYQKVGNVKTSKPLLVVGQQGESKNAVMLAEGMWRWKLQEASAEGESVAFNSLISKLTQFLSAKEDKRRFRVYPIENEFEDTETIVFETEIYNDIYEQIYGAEVELIVTNEAGESRSFQYTTNTNNTQYRISNLAEGIYQYTASTNVQGEALSSKGEFTVKSLQIESLSLTANHHLLQQLADESGGQFFTQESAEDLLDSMSEQQAQGKIYTSEAYLPIINLKWMFFLIMVLLTAEWGIRKYQGSY